MARVTDRRLSRRAFLGASAAGGAALLLGGSSAPALADAEEEVTGRERSVVRGDDPAAPGPDGFARAQQPRADQGLSPPDQGAQSAPRRGHRDQPAGDRHRGPARRRATTPSRARSAPRHPGPGQGQHRDPRPDGDDRRLACPRRQPRPGRRRARGFPPAGRRGHPRQGQPLRVGQLPRVPPGRFPERLERPGRVHPQPVRARLGPVRVELRIGRGGRREPLLGDRRIGDRWLDPVPGREQRRRRAQADPWTGPPDRDHPDRTLAGHGRADHPDRDRRGDHAQRHARAVRARARPPVAARLHRVPGARRPRRSGDRRRSAQFPGGVLRGPRAQRGHRAGARRHGVAGRHDRRHRDRGLPRPQRLVRRRSSRSCSTSSSTTWPPTCRPSATRACARWPT